MDELARTLRRLVAELGALDLHMVEADAMTRIGERLQAEVVSVLSQPVGGEHTVPWERSGALRESIHSEVEANELTVGSTDAVAVFQEIGTARIPPRPFLVPAAMAGSQAARDDVGQAVANAIREAVR